MTDKKSLISRFAENDEEKTTLSHILDLAERSYSRSTVEAGNFLSDSMRLKASQMLKAAGYNSVFFWGGYDGAERACPVFCTDYFGEDTIKNDPYLAELVFIKAELDRFNKDAELSHRDVLGSLMALGIERETVGDISMENGSAVFVVKSSIAPFIVEDLAKIGRYPVKVSSHSRLTMEKKEDFEECFDTVPSLRLDAVAASLFSTSRSVAADAVSQGLVALNGAVVKKCDLSVSEGDKLSFRGKGRAELEKADGISKKGRIRILYKKWR